MIIKTYIWKRSWKGGRILGELSTQIIKEIILTIITAAISLMVPILMAKNALRRKICITWKLTEQEYDRSFHKQIIDTKTYEIVQITLIICEIVFLFYHYFSIFTNQRYGLKDYISKYEEYTLEMISSILFLWIIPIVIVMDKRFWRRLFTKLGEGRNDVEEFASRVSESFLSTTLIILPLLSPLLFFIGTFMYSDGKTPNINAITFTIIFLAFMVYLIGIEFPRKQCAFHRYYYANILDIDPYLCGVIPPSLEKSNVKIGVLSEDETRWKCVLAKLCNPYKERSNTKKIKEFRYIAILIVIPIVVCNPLTIYYIGVSMLGDHELRNVFTDSEFYKDWRLLTSLYIIFFEVSILIFLRKSKELRKLVRYKVNPDNVFYLPKDQFKDKVTFLDYQLCIADEDS